MTFAEKTSFPGMRFRFEAASLFLALALLIGGIFSVVIPYGAGFDEGEHLTRIYDISGGWWLPNNNPPTFKNTLTREEFFSLSYQRRLVQTPAFDMFTPEMLGVKFSPDEAATVYGYRTRSIYSPVMFLPQALVARVVWRYLDFPVLPGVMLARLAGLLVYIAGCYLAIRLLPFGKWLLAVLALSPMALFQAATLNADGFTNAASFLLIALVLHLALKSPEPIHWKWILALVGAALLVGFAKPGVVVILALLLMLPVKRISSKAWLAVLALGLLLAVAANVGWTALAVEDSHFASGGKQSISGRLALILAQPLEFIATFAIGFSRSLVDYFQDWTAAYGYWAGTVPGPVYFFYFVLLVAVVLLEPQSESLSRAGRSWLLGTFLLAAGVTLGMYFVANYSPGNYGVFGRQGRYFIPFGPLFFMSLLGLVKFPAAWRQVVVGLAAACFALVIGFYSFGLYATYYTDCGYEAYAGAKCSLPIYKNLDRETAPGIELTQDPLRQFFVTKCTDLTGIDLFVKTAPSDSASTLRVALLDAGQRVLAYQEFPVAGIENNAYLVWEFPPLEGQGERYELKLELLGAPLSGAGPSFGATTGNFPDSKLFVGEQDFRGDLIFHYICLRP